MDKFGYRFSFGPWNIHEGADPFGPPVRPGRTFDEKLKALKELGFDACIDYKAGNLLDNLRAACPKGVDAYFENVGGEILDAVLRLMNLRGRITICGLIADYNAKEPYGVKMFRSILVNRLKVQGMIVFDWAPRYAEANQALLELVVGGKLKYRESVVQGLENAPKGLIGLLKGENFGKQLVKLA